MSQKETFTILPDPRKILSKLLLKMTEASNILDGVKTFPLDEIIPNWQQWSIIS